MTRGIAKTGIVVTGLPASGKTTVGRHLAEGLGLPLLDKDAFLEELYADHTVRTWDDRKKLSRQSDGVFRAAADASGSAVLVSHWRPPGQAGGSGTDTGWLAGAYTSLIEVCCQCPATVALARFHARVRHPGHLDQQRDPGEMARWFVALEDWYPLGLGTLVTVDAAGAVDHDGLLAKVRDLLADRD